MTDFTQIAKAALFSNNDDFTKHQAGYCAFMQEEGYNHVLIINSDFDKMLTKATLNDSQLEWMDMDYYELEKYTSYYDAFVNCRLYSVAFVDGNVVLQDEVNLVNFFDYLVSKNTYKKITYDLDFIGITKKFVKHLKNNECQLALAMICSCEHAACNSYSALVIKKDNNFIVPFLVDSHSAAEFYDIFFDLEAITKDALGLSDTKYVDLYYYTVAQHLIMPYGR